MLSIRSMFVRNLHYILYIVLFVTSGGARDRTAMIAKVAYTCMFFLGLRIRTRGQRGSPTLVFFGVAGGGWGCKDLAWLPTSFSHL